MSACIYICHNCPACERIVDYLKNEHKDVQIVNVQDEKHDIPRIQIFPALFIDEKLVAYGDDIKAKLK